MWMVFVEGRRSPRFIHASEEEAKAEAERLKEKEHLTAHVVRIVHTFRFDHKEGDNGLV